MRKMIGAALVGVLLSGMLLMAYAAQRPAAAGAEIACKGCDYDDGRKAG